MSEYLGFEPTKSSDYYFVSYNSEDVKRISPIVKQIAADGVPLWYDYDLEYGAAWKRQITERIQNSQAVILFFTKGIFAKEESFVQTEYEIAVFLEKKIYVIIMDDIIKKDVPIRFVTWYLEVTDHHCVKVTRAKTTVEQVGIIEKAIGHVSLEEPVYSTGLAFSPLDDGTYAVSGIGNCRDKDIRIPPVTPNGGRITAIGDMAFSDCTDLTSVAIPDDVTSIGGHAFADCTSLMSVSIPDSVTFIDCAAFTGCTGLTSVTIPDSVTSIGEYAFFYCSSLTSITIPNSVALIGGAAFSCCTSLTSIMVENGNFNYYSQNNCVMERSTGTLIIGIQSSCIPDGVTSIGEGAFDGCHNLTSVTIPDSVTSIGSYAFLDCPNLTSITIPDSVTFVSEEAFCNHPNLTIYCAHPQRPAVWDENWNPSNRPVIWNYKG